MSQDYEQPELIDHDAARRNGRRIVALVVAVTILSAAVGLAVALVHPRHNGHHHQGFVGVLIVLAALVVLAGITVPLLLHVYKRPNFARMLQFSWGRRRRVTKALRKGRPVLPEDRAVAAALVRTMRQQRRLPYLFGAVSIIYLLKAVFDHGFQRWFAIALVAMYVVLIASILRQRRTILANYDRLEGGANSSNQSGAEPPR